MARLLVAGMAARWARVWVPSLAMVTVVEREGMWGVALELKSEILTEEEMGVKKVLVRAVGREQEWARVLAAAWVPA